MAWISRAGVGKQCAARISGNRQDQQGAARDWSVSEQGLILARLADMYSISNRCPGRRRL